MVNVLIGVLLFLWLLNGVINYFTRIKLIRAYDEIIKKMEQENEELNDTYLESINFIHIQNLKNEYGFLEDYREELESSPVSSKLKLLLSFMVLGPLYNWR